MTDQLGTLRINGFGDGANIDIVERYKDMGDGTHARVVTAAPSTPIQIDAGGRVRVGQLITLGDYKNVEYDHTLLMENAGTGTGAWSDNKYNMTVAANQWLIKTSRRYHHYFSGKSQVPEITFDNFQPESGVVKRCGYFSSGIVSPYSSTLDGFWLESDGETIRIKAQRAGVETLNVPLAEWDGYSVLAEYQDASNWENFTVAFFDFLWLGGAIINLYIQTSNGFVLAHRYIHAGAEKDVFILTPNQPIRYEIRSSAGSGSFRYICSQVSTEGSTSEYGHSHAVDTGSSGMTASSIGTKYPLKSVRRNSSYRSVVAKIDHFDILVNSLNDRIYWTLEINPTLSAGLTYSNIPNTGLQHASGNGTITVTSPGQIISSGYHLQGTPFPTNVLNENFLSYLGQSLDGTQDEYVLCVVPITSNVDTFGGITVKEY